jgi:hypothetical protein
VPARRLNASSRHHGPFFLWNPRVGLSHPYRLGGNTMTIPRRRFLHLAAIAAAVAAIYLYGRCGGTPPLSMSTPEGVWPAYRTPAL